MCFDTGENEPCKVCPLSMYRSPRFNPELVVRGIIIDRLNGNLVKVDRFGYVRRAMHGTALLSPEEIRVTYGAEPPVDLRDSRWTFTERAIS